MTDEEQKIADAEALAAKEMAEKEAKEKEEQDAKANGSKEDEKTLEQKNKELFARTKKAEDEAKKLREDMKKLLEDETQKKETKDDKNPNEEKISPIEVAMLAKQLAKYDDKEIAYAEKLARVEGIKLVDALNHQDFKDYIDVKKEKDRINKTTLSPENKSIDVKKKDPMFDKWSSNLPKGFDFTKKK